MLFILVSGFTWCIKCVDFWFLTKFRFEASDEVF